MGWIFRVVIADDEVDIAPLLPNALAIFADKFAYIGTRERIAMEETFEAKGAVAYRRRSKPSRPLGGFSDERSRKVLHALVCTRSAAIDINRKITRDTAVTKPETKGRR